jgi:hypothetical protein
LSGEDVEDVEDRCRLPLSLLEEIRTDEKVEVRGDVVLLYGPGLFEATGLRTLNVGPELKSEVARGVRP